MKRTDPVKLSSVLDNIIERQKIRGRMAERQAVSLWPQIVGPQLSSQVRAIDAAGGVLTLKCDVAVIRQEIMITGNALMKNLNELCGKEVITSIRFVSNNEAR